MDYTSDNESLTLSSHALAALQEFLTEKQEHEERFNALQAAAEARHEKSKKENEEGDDQENDPLFSIDLFKEDWQVNCYSILVLVYKVNLQVYINIAKSVLGKEQAIAL
jgi:hypothetical protein